MYRATRISVCVVAVSKSREFLLKVGRLSSFFFDDDAYAFTSTRRNFFDDDARDSTSTTSRRFFHDVGHLSGLFRAVAGNIQVNGAECYPIRQTHRYAAKSPSTSFWGGTYGAVTPVLGLLLFRPIQDNSRKCSHRHPARHTVHCILLKVNLISANPYSQSVTWPRSHFLRCLLHQSACRFSSETFQIETLDTVVQKRQNVGQKLLETRASVHI